ncbi:MAG: hypothetical protein HYY02_12745 [Chloroflexi bacterium]|nr:hypothetical protein [Chloroflexota bacterium]
MIRTEDVPAPEAKPGILSSLLGMKVRTVPSLPTVSPEVLLVVEANMKESREATVVLRWPRRESKQLEQQLTASRRGVRYRF